MPALPPKLGKNPTPEEVENYREQLEEYEKVLAEKKKAQKVTAKEQEEKEAENTRSQARLEKWKQQLTIDSEKLEADRERFGADRERLDIDLEKLKIDTKAQETQKKELEEWEKTLKVEQAKIDVLKEEGLPPAGGIDPAIIIQQKQLLEKCFTQNQATTNLVARQLKLEEQREIREKEKEKKEEEKEKLKMATGKGFKPPSFRGIQGERPEAHILRAEDWMDASNPTMEEKQKIKNFRLTLDHHAREWYDTADCKGTWKDLKLGFSRYFSTQGRSVYNLHERWKMFKFNPQTDDIEEFVRNVQETATQLNYGNEAVANMIKTCMPMDMYTSLYEVTNYRKDNLQS